MCHRCVTARQTANMADPVAITSIVATAAVGLAATGTQAWLAIDGRKHERRMAAEARALEVRRERREFDLALSRWCVDVRRRLRSPDFSLFNVLMRSADLDAAITVHADRVLRQALLRFDAEVSGIQGALADPLLAVESHRRQKEEAIDATKFDLAVQARDAEKQAMRQAVAHLQPIVAALDAVEEALANNDG